MNIFAKKMKNNHLINLINLLTNMDEIDQLLHNIYNKIDYYDTYQKIFELSLQQRNYIYEKVKDKQDADSYILCAIKLLTRYPNDEDCSRAIELYHKAVGLNNEIAMERLGIIFYEGRYVARNDNIAVELFKKAITAGVINEKDRIIKEQV